MATGGSRLLSEIATLSRQLAPALLERSQLLTKAQSSRSPNLSVSEGKAELQELVSLVSKLSANDLGMTLPNQEDFSHAPCIYTGIYEPESALLSMSLFSLRDAGSQLPLHDHPGMHGLIKVLKGRIRVLKYSWLDPVVEQQMMPPPPQPLSSSKSRNKYGSLRPARFEGFSVLSPEDSACVLEPINGNIHTIAAVDGSSTFFDLLLPSYDPPARDCFYYEVATDDQKRLPESTNGLCWLRRIRIPPSYFCDSLMYTGPKI